MGKLKPPIYKPAINEIYVTKNKTKSRSYIRRTKKLLLEKKFPCVIINGLGSAVQNAKSVADAVKKELHDQVSLEQEDSIVKVYEEVLSNNKDQIPKISQTEKPSISIQIRLLSNVRNKI
ncbi:hypothetical protein BB559_001072 [Furculomyces boomerangus]|uniref:DNA/RNA-binding protein Alba-like domain-containing protein n=2 Tax=Harpellales TaxID=61421 RepID=A0A2T9Z353_9FUNG|nr:hypothetical protein BB559_001072 [Furculomyces boomerangus]PWA00328.1 hypothetical protein BB558_003630 [Smittium angustum]